MKKLIYIIVGICFGIIMYKSEAASWFRIYEMFQFKSFHMYGIIASAIAIGIVITQIIKRRKVNSVFGDTIKIDDKEKGFKKKGSNGFALEPEKK